MLRHADIWRAIDTLAAEHGLSTSGLARRAGLDPTTFNKSKRVTAEGKQRWPSTESVAKILTATGTKLGDFVGLIDGVTGAARPRLLPVIGHAEAGNDGYFDDAGYPAGQGWDEVAVPSVEDPHAYALEVSGNSMEPAYREGDTLIVSPGAQIRRGDRVVVKLAGGEVLTKELRRQTATRVELRSLNPDFEDRLVPLEDIRWIARIVWASQ